MVKQMKNPVHERIKAVRTTLKLSQRDFSKGIFLEQSSYARIEQGAVKPNERIIELICAKYRVNKTYLKENKGDMFSAAPPDAKLDQLNQIFNELNIHFKDYLIKQAKELLKVQQKQDDN
jgi:transcriptional regulator with XRE-family HTH domain